MIDYRHHAIPNLVALASGHFLAHYRCRNWTCGEAVVKGTRKFEYCIEKNSLNIFYEFVYREQKVIRVAWTKLVEVEEAVEDVGAKLERQFLKNFNLEKK